MDNSEFGLPAVTTIRQERTRNQTKEGYCASIYSNMRANVGDETNSGRLLVDECELKLGIIMNEKTRQVYGVVDDDSYDLKMAFDNMMESVEMSHESKDNEKNEKKPFVTPVKKVLQYRYVPFHSKHNAFNCEYFFNDGTLKSHKMLKTLVHVIICLELFNFRVDVLVMDAGEPNKGLIKLLTGKKLPQKGWLQQENVSFENPYDSKRLIFLIFYATHSLKAFRNALFNSALKGTRHIMNCENIKLDWKQMHQ